MIRIVYGCSGSGKSRRIYELMKEDVQNGTPSYLIVPEQETVRCERRLLDLLPPSAQLSTEVLNFSRLANLVFRKHGGLSYNYADKGSKALIMWKNLKELAPLLSEYGKAAEGNTAVFASEMLSAIGELKAYCVTPTKLERAAEKLDGNESLKKKLYDLSLIMSSYQNYFSESFSDVSDDLTSLAQILKDADFFNGVNVYIDSFTSFTAQEYAVIEEIFRSAKNTTVTLTLDSAATTQIHYESTADTAFRLQSIASELSIPTVEEKLPHTSTKAPAINAIASSLWIPNATFDEIDASEDIEIIKCSSPYDEAEAAANIILSLLKSGMRCRDIALIARDASTYRSIVDTALEKADIPYFFSQNSDIMSKSPVKFLIAALRIKIYGWRAEDVIAYLKTGICAVEDRDIDLLECYLSVWNVRGSAFVGEDWTMNPDGYTEYFSDRAKEILRRVNICKNTIVPPLVRLFTLLDSAENVTDMCRALYTFMEESHMAEILSEKASREYELGRRRESAELLQLYNSVVKALENISASIGESEMTVKEFADALKIMFDGISVGAIPTAEDQVIIGSASTLRASDIKCAILIGVNEGEFPQNVKETGVFSDRDKELLADLDITLSANTSTRSADELFYLYRAMTYPSEKLFILYHSSDLSGNATPESIGIQRISKLFPSLSEKKYSDIPIGETMLCKSVAIEKLPLIKNTPEGIAISKYFEALDDYKEKLICADTPSRNTVCRLDEETVEAVYPSTLKLTQSKIDDYVGCPFEYMCKRIFMLNEISPASFDYFNFGTYIHYIFENYLRNAVADGMIGKEPDTDYIQRKIDESANMYIDSFFKNGELDEPRLSHRFIRMRRLATLVATNLTREFAHSSFRPEFFELSIGKPDKEISLSPLLLTSSEGRAISLDGKVDRVDILRRENEVFVRVIDYKSGSKTFSRKDIENAQNVQLPLYLFALCDEDQKGFRKALGVPEHTRLIPAGALYISSKIEAPELSANNYDISDALKKAEEAIGRSGFLINDIDILKEMNDELSSQFLCGIKLNKNGSLRASSTLVSNEEMEQMQKELNDAVIRVADEMLAGNMDASPSCIDKHYNCENCSMSAICRSKRKD